MKNVFAFLLFFLVASLHAQRPELDQVVSLSYQQVPLGKVLGDISQKYQVHFSYSKDFIPLDEKMNVEVRDEKLSFALEALFAPTKIVFAPIGDQVVLKINPNKKIELPETPEYTGSLDKEPELFTTKKPVYADRPVPFVPQQRETPGPPPPTLRTPSLEPVDWPAEFPQPDHEIMLVRPTNFDLADRYTRIAQVSVLPDVGTNFQRSEDITNNVSVNVLWGHNGGVNGVEVGGIVNSIEGDVRGVQIAGMANLVKGDVKGSSLRKGKSSSKAGVQISGITNVAGSMQGCQLTGGFNQVYAGDLEGFQVAGLGNTVVGNASGWQVAGLYNFNGGNAGFQLSGIMNVANDVAKGQISGLLNVGHDVRGLQLGLVNVCDTIDGVTIGLLNFVRHGYNRLEISYSDILNANVGIKFGSRHFYNILHFGTPLEKSVGSIFSKTPNWGIGYGIGTSVGRKNMTWQMEAVVIHVNEGGALTRGINLLNQLRLTADIRLGRCCSLFAGPVVNLMVSDQFDPDSGEYGSKLLPTSTFYDELSSGSKTRRVTGWLSFQGGLRF